MESAERREGEEGRRGIKIRVGKRACASTVFGPLALDSSAERKTSSEGREGTCHCVGRLVRSAVRMESAEWVRGRGKD